MNSEKTLMKYGFVSILLIASFLMAVPANQYQKVLAQSEGESSEDNQGNTTQVQENVTDAEIPSFENQNATFVPPPEGDREAPPIPADAIKGADLPKETPPKDSDSQPLSVSNRTELLEVLPANSTKIIEHVDQDLKNSTGEGLLPPAILDKIISGEGQNNDTILDISTPQELDEIKNFSDSTTNQTTEEAIDEGEPIANITNATGLGGLPEAGNMNATNATQGETQGNEEQAQTGEAVNMINATSGAEEDKKSSDNQEQQTGAGEAVNMTNATSGAEEDKKSNDNQDQQTGDEEDKKSSDNQEQQTGAGEEQTNITNATSAMEPNMTSAITGEGQQSQDQQQTGDEEDKKSNDNHDQQTGDEEDKKSSDNQDQQTGAGEEQTNITNATSAMEPNMTSAITGEGQQSQDQQQTGDEEDKKSNDNQDQQTGDEEDKKSSDNQDQQQTGDEGDKQSETREAPPLPSTLNATNATAMLNSTNITGMPGADSEDDEPSGNDNSEDE